MANVNAATIQGRLTSSENLSATLSASVVTVGSSDADVYSGSYQIEPEVYAQDIPTEGKLMSADLTVKKIRISRVRNSAGGQTCVIGGN